MARDHNLAGRPSDVLYNALDPAKLARYLDLQAEFEADRVLVVGVTRYVVQKNFHCYWKGSGLRSGPPTGRQRVLLVGEPSAAGRGDRKAGPDRPGVLTGYRRDVPAFLKVARVLAMPSDYEGLPVTHLEALFCGVPAVVSDRVPSLKSPPRPRLVATGRRRASRKADGAARR